LHRGCNAPPSVSGLDGDEEVSVADVVDAGVAKTLEDPALEGVTVEPPNVTGVFKPVLAVEADPVLLAGLAFVVVVVDSELDEVPAAGLVAVELDSPEDPVALGFVEAPVVPESELVSADVVVAPLFVKSPSPAAESVALEPGVGLSQPDAGLSVDLRRSPSATGGCRPFDFRGFRVFLEGFSVSSMAAGLVTSWCSCHISSSETPSCA